MNFTKFSAALAGLSLICGTALAQSEPVQVPEFPGAIIIELQPGETGDSESAAAERALVQMLLMQLLANLGPEDDQQELEIVVPPSANPGTGI